VLDAALRRYDAARRDLGAESVLVLSPLERWAESEELCSYFANKAALAGLDTPEGERLLARRDVLEGRANRAMTAALAAATAIGTARRTATTSPLDALRARAAQLTKTTPAIAPEKADRE
jgi:hypothetical protein